MMRTRVVILGLLPLLAAGCPKQQQQDKKTRRLQVFAVQLKETTPPGLKLPGLDQTALLGRAEQLVRGAKVFERVSGAGPAAYRIRIELSIMPDLDDLTAEELVLAGSARASLPDSVDGLVLQSSGLLPLAVDSGEVELGASARRVLEGLLADLVYQATLALAPEPELAKALAQSDPRRLEAAVEIAAMRRARGAVPALIKLLKHERQEIVDRAIGALVAIGDRRAVHHLTRLVELRDTELLAKVIDGIGTLGGKEARQYLELVASGHSDEDIQSLAREALERMKRAGK